MMGDNLLKNINTRILNIFCHDSLYLYLTNKLLSLGRHWRRIIFLMDANWD